VIFAEGLLETISLLVELSIEAFADFFGDGVAAEDELFAVETVETLPVLALLLELLLALGIRVTEEVVEERALSCLSEYVPSGT
jgi:hypothetical protein